MAWNISKERKTKRISSGDQYIEIRQLNQGDRDEMLDMLMEMDSGKSKKQLEKEKKALQQGQQQKVSMKLGAMRHFRRWRSIVKWHLKYDEDGSEIPLTEDALKNLPEDVIAELDEAIEELNPELDDEKKSE